MKKLTNWKPERKCNHVFPMHLYIPPGKTVKIKCSNCGKEIEVTGSGATF